MRSNLGCAEQRISRCSCCTADCACEDCSAHGHMLQITMLQVFRFDAGGMIGRGGEKINTIQQRHNAFIQAIQEAPPHCLERVVVIAGPRDIPPGEQYNAPQKAIFDLFENQLQLDRSPGSERVLRCATPALLHVVPPALCLCSVVLPCLCLLLSCNTSLACWMPADFGRHRGSLYARAPMISGSRSYSVTHRIVGCSSVRRKRAV